MKVVLAGATGFIGNELVQQLLQDGHEPVVLTRDPAKIKSRYGTRVRGVLWNSKDKGAWTGELENAAAVVNFTGESIAGKRWTRRQKEIIRSSRIDSTRAIVDAIQQTQAKPELLINASAVGYYGNVPEGDATEDFPAADDFLGTLSKAWEQEALRAEEFGLRVVCLRIGIVLGSKGGALEKMVPPFKYFIGGPIGKGKQWFPWVHQEDVTGAIHYIMKSPALSGPVNVTAPNAVRNKEFCRLLGKVLHRPSWLRVSCMALTIAVGELAHSLLTGQKAIPKKLLDHGYRFRFPELNQALEDLLSKQHRQG